MKERSDLRLQARPVHPVAGIAVMAQDRRLARRRFLLGSGALGLTGALPTAAAQPRPDDGLEIFVNNVGYEPTSRKRAIIGGPAADRMPFTVVDLAARAVVFRGDAASSDVADDWSRDHFPAIPSRFWIADFSKLDRPGDYTVAVGSNASWPFRIEQNVLERRTLTHLTHYFKDSRSSGQFDKADRALPIKGTAQRWDAHGGWYDAAADWGKHFTQLSDLSYFNTLSIPLTAWVLLASHDDLLRRGDPNFVHLRNWMLDEGFFGTDYLVRVHPSTGSFYSGVSQPEADDLSIDPAARTLNPRQVDYREGGGLAIAALARASTHDVSGELTSADYLAAAQGAFAFLQQNNVGLTNDGKENILDDCNALLAATELFKATRDAQYRRAADARATSLLGRLKSWQGHRDYWRADDGDRPFFHPSDAGLPIVSLLTYLDIAPAETAARVLSVIRRSLEFELSITREVPNPFGYARQLVQDRAGNRYSGFFMPQDVAPRSDDVWWQGENARIASLAAAARHAARHFPADAFADRLRSYALDQLDWILGLNPFNVCMLEGVGRSAPLYLEYGEDDPAGSWRWLRSAGGIVNGITGRNKDGRGIQWDPGRSDTGPNTDWRWLEQWLPHTTWLLYAVTVGG